MSAGKNSLMLLSTCFIKKFQRNTVRVILINYYTFVSVIIHVIFHFSVQPSTSSVTSTDGGIEAQENINRFVFIII